MLVGVLYAQNNLTSTAVQRYFNPVRRNLEASADVMPPEKYGFKLTDGQMTFAEWLIHSAQRNYTDCATLKSESVPDAAKPLATLKDKAEVSKALKDSFAYCAAALEGVDDQKVLASPQMSNAFCTSSYTTTRFTETLSAICARTASFRRPPRRVEARPRNSQRAWFQRPLNSGFRFSMKARRPS